MRKSSRRYLDDLRGLEEVLLRQLALKFQIVEVNGIPARRYVKPPTRKHWRQLLTLCRQEIERVEKALKP